MKNKFTDLNIGDYTVVKVDNLEPCIECGQLTQYIDYCFELRVCSKECDDKVTEDIMNTI